MRVIETMARLLLLCFFLISLPCSILLIAANIVPEACFIYIAICFFSLFGLAANPSILGLTVLILGLIVLFFYIFYARLRYHAPAASLICVFLSLIIIQTLRHFHYGSGYYGFFPEIEGPKVPFYKITGLVGGLVIYCAGVFFFKRLLAKRCLSGFMKIFISTLLWVSLFCVVALLFIYDDIKVYNNIITVIAIIASLTMYFLGGFLLKERPFQKGTSRFVKIFFSTLLWMAVFDIYTILAFKDLEFKEGIKTRGDAIKFFMGFILFYLPTIIIFLWNVWLLVWGHYYLIVKKIKNTPVYYLTSILYILTAWALWLISILRVFDKNILELCKKHILQPYFLSYVLTAFLLAFLQRRQFKDLSKAKTPSDDHGL